MQRLSSILATVVFGCATLFAQTTNRVAPGAPGKDAHWPSAAKQGFGTANTLRSKVWFTLGEGVLTEIYFPTIDVPNSQMLQLVVVTAAGKVETESEDTTHSVQVLDNARSLSFRQENKARSGAYLITKTYAVDPQRDSLLIEVRFRWQAKGPCPCSLYVFDF
jgi:glucoamylase